jgi:hypothetical protein
MQARGVGPPAVVVEAVIQRAVDHGVEPPVVTGEAGGIGDSEAHRHPALGRPAAGLVDGCRGTIEAGEALVHAGDFAERVGRNQQQLGAELRPQYDFIVCGSGSSGTVVGVGDARRGPIV